MPSILISGLTKVQSLASRLSWKLYQTQNYVIEDRGVKLPVAHGIGLDMIGEPVHPLLNVIK